MKRWRCTICGYIHDGEQPPYRCPVCGAPAELFELLTEAAVAVPT
jgi:rubrerythrin